MPTKPKRGTRTNKNKATKSKTAKPRTQSKPKKVAIGFDQNITKKRKVLS